MAGAQGLWIGIASAMNSALWDGTVGICALATGLDLHHAWLAVFSLLTFSATAMCLQVLREGAERGEAALGIRGR